MLEPDEGSSPLVITKACNPYPTVHHRSRIDRPQGTGVLSFPEG